MKRVAPTALLVLALGSCVKVSGGAVQFSWQVWNVGADPRAPTAMCPSPAADIRLALRPLGADGGLASGPAGICPDGGACVFSCDAQHGTTRFEIPPGTYSFAATLECSPGVPVPGCSVRDPAPIVRAVSTGSVTDLEALIFVTFGANPCSTPCPDGGRAPADARATEAGTG